MSRTPRRGTWHVIPCRVYVLTNLEAERHPVAAMQVVSFADMRIQPRCPPVHLLLSGRLACQPLRADWGCYDDSHIAR